jgi:membrane protease YdiL (CAAX protease family)
MPIDYTSEESLKNLYRILAPVSEELLFRYYIMYVFFDLIYLGMERLKKTPDDTKVLFSVIIIESVHFAVFHPQYFGSIISLYLIFSAGFILGILYYFTRSLTSCMVFHLLWNLGFGSLACIFMVIIGSIILFRAYLDKRKLHGGDKDV